jgi:hypothetical protein
MFIIIYASVAMQHFYCSLASDVNDYDHVVGWDYVSELRPPTGPLFILQVIYEHGEPWWNDIDRGSS